jgi:hypothetical protein
MSGFLLVAAAMLPAVAALMFVGALTEVSFFSRKLRAFRYLCGGQRQTAEPVKSP